MSRRERLPGSSLLPSTDQHGASGCSDHNGRETGTVQNGISLKMNFIQAAEDVPDTASALDAVV